VPSRDEIGREFPLACSERVPRDLAELGWSLLLGLYEVFLGDVEALLARTCAQQPGQLLEAAQAELALLSRPHPSELVRAAADAQARFATESVARFEQRAFGAGTHEPMPYALLTLREAARRGGAELTLDLPVAGAFDLFAWLELAACFADTQPRFPALIWCPQQARALLAAAAPSPLTMAFLVDRRHASSSRWPLWTERAAGAQAVHELTPAAREVLAAQGSLAELAASLRSAG
jgi:hypothetical protein